MRWSVSGMCSTWQSNSSAPRLRVDDLLAHRPGVPPPPARPTSRRTAGGAVPSSSVTRLLDPPVHLGSGRRLRAGRDRSCGRTPAVVVVAPRGGSSAGCRNIQRSTFRSASGTADMSPMKGDGQLVPGQHVVPGVQHVGGRGRSGCPAGAGWPGSQLPGRAGGRRWGSPRPSGTGSPARPGVSISARASAARICSRRVRPAGLLQPDVVVHAHPGQLGHLLAAQPWGAPPPAAGQPHLTPAAAGTAARAGRRPARGCWMPPGRTPSSITPACLIPGRGQAREGGTAGPRLGRALPTARRRRRWSHDNDCADYRRQQGHRLPDRRVARHSRHDGARRRAGRGAGPAGRKGLRDGGADARFVQLDVTGEESVRQAAKWVETEFGVLDVLSTTRESPAATGTARRARPRWPRCARGSRPTCSAWWR